MAGDGQSRDPSRLSWKELLSLTCLAVGSTAGKVWLAPGPSWAWLGEALSDRVSHLLVHGRRWRRMAHLTSAPLAELLQHAAGSRLPLALLAGALHLMSRERASSKGRGWGSGGRERGTLTDDAHCHAESGEDQRLEDLSRMALPVWLSR